MNRDYYTTKPYYNRPQLDPEEQLPYPIIIQVESLNDRYNRGNINRPRQPMGSRSMIYFPRSSQATNTRCTCPECVDKLISRQPSIDKQVSRRRSSNEDIASEPLQSNQPEDKSTTKTPSPAIRWQPPSPCPTNETTITKVNIDKEVLSPEAPASDYNYGSEKSSNSANSKSYVCHVCERGFTWFGNFQKHMLTHGDQSQDHPYFAGGDVPEEQIIIREDNSTFRCGICNKTFSRMSGLRTHIRMHNGQRPFKCNHCDLAFTTNRALKMHTRIHSGERPYKCNQCTKTFTRKDELQAHIYLHKGEVNRLLLF